jgi:hypothetical protein
MTKIRLLLLSIIILQTTATATPAFPQEVTRGAGVYASPGHQADLKSQSASSPPRKVIVVDSPTADAMASVSSGRPWTPGNETATRPWSAPAGHHQPRAVDVLTSVSSVEQFLDEEDARVDRIVRNICRGC